MQKTINEHNANCIVEVVESIVMQLNDFLSGALVAFFPLLPAHFIRPVLQLAISDVNKLFLVKCAAGLLKLLVEAFFLDPLHVRAETACETKAAVQADAVTCCLQLACFEPGRGSGCCALSLWSSPG